MSFHIYTINGARTMLLSEMEIFYNVANLKNFSKTAQLLGVSKSFISKRMTKLEKDLKVRLLARSTRKLTLTEAGYKFYQQCIKVIEEAQKGYLMMQVLQSKPSGVLKISVPPALGFNLLAPMFVKFLNQYPEIKLDIELENKPIDLIAQGYDLALRSAKLESSNLIAQRIFAVKNILCATPKYLKKHGIPKNPIELETHNFAAYNYSKDTQNLKMTKNDTKKTVRIQGNFRSNHLDLIKKIVLDHVCIAVFPEFMVKDELKNHQLIHCLAEYQLSTSPFYAIYPEREFMPLKVRVFLKMLELISK